MRILFASFLLVLGIGVFAQNDIAVTGKVTEKGSGEPLIGVAVVVEGTQNGTVTSLDGGYTIQKVPKDANLIFTYIGYKNITRRASQVVNVEMEDNVFETEEVVVIGYGTAKKRDLTGSIASVNATQLANKPSINPLASIQGLVSGVQVVTNGRPGQDPEVRIRGTNSVNGYKPLYVVDGLLTDNINYLNPADIETMDILKDPSSLAIFGVRGANGVIAITTKKAKEGTSVNINTSLGFKTVVNKVKLTDAFQFRELYTEQRANQGITIPYDYTNWNANTDWQDQIFRTAVSTDHHVSINGGFKNLPYRVSLGYTDDNGIVKTSNFRRFTASVNLAPSFFEDHLKFNINAKFMNGKNRYADTGAAIGGALAIDPTRPVYSNEDPYQFTGGYWQNINSTTGFSNPDWKYTSNPNSPQNPLAALELKNDKANSNDFVGNVDVDYKFHFLPDLRLHASIGGEYAEGTQTTIVSPYSFGNNYYGWNGDVTQYKYNLSYNIYVQYIKSLGANDFDIMVGGEEQHFHRNGFEEGQGWDSYTQEPHDAKLREQTAYATRNTLVSYFGRLNYSLLNRYLFTFTMRWDGSSRFSKDNRWGTFPSLALGWKIKEENFLKDVNVLSDLKLRLGWGITGQQNIGDDFAYLPLYVVNNEYAQYPFGDTYYSTSRPKAFNENLKWEKTTTWNAGLDFGFLNGRITGGIDGYFRKTDDLLNSVKIPVGTNFNAQMTQNIGSLENYGMEFSINAKPIVTKDFTWDLSYNITWNHNEITKLTGGDDSDYYVEAGDKISRGNNTKVQAHKVGYAANSFYVYQQVYDENGKPIENMFVDRNGNGTIDSGDKYIYKKPAGDVLMGLTSKMQYKNFDFSFSLRASLNNYVYYDFLSNKANVSTSGLFSNNAYSNTSAEAVALGFSGQGDYYMSDYFIHNASFLRCDNITLGYSFQNLWKTQTYKGVGGRVYATVQNPFIISKYKGLDPEVKSGIDANPYPRAMTFLLGLSLQF